MGKRNRKARREHLQATRSEKIPLIRVGTGPALGEAMPAEAVGYRSGRRGRSNWQQPKETHPWLAAERDVQTVAVATRNAEYGDTRQMQDVISDIAKRDGRVRACASTRCHGLTSRKWLVKPPQGWEQDTEAKAIAERCSDVIAEIEEWPQVIGWLSSGIVRGFAVVEIIWGTNRKGWWVPVALKWRASNRFTWDSALQPCRAEMGEAWPGTPLAELKPDSWIVHAPASGWPDYPHNTGLGVPCIPGAMLKRHGWKGWLKGVKKYGVPFAFMRVPTSAEGDDLEDEAHRILRRMSDDGGTVVLRGGADQIGFDTVQGTGEYTGEVHRTLVEAANLEHAIILLGQNLTTEVQGGSFAAAMAHNFVRGDLLAGDAMELGVTIRRGLLEPLCRLNGWTGAPHPVYETQLSHQGEIKAEDVAAGHFTSDEYRGWKGYAPKPNGAGATFQVAPTAQPAPMNGGGAPAPGPFSLPRPNLQATNGQTIPKGTTPTSLRGVPKIPS